MIGSDILAFLLVMFMPGFIMSYAFFLPGESIAEGRLDDRIVRFLLSVGLSLLLIPVCTYVLNCFMTIGPDTDSLIAVLAMALSISVISVVLRILGERFTA